MSLIDEMMSPCVFMEKTRVPDGEGGYTTLWKEGAELGATIVRGSSVLSEIADAIKEKRTYTVTVKRGVILETGDVIKRVSDGATFKITSESVEMMSPISSSLDIAQSTAERWELT